MQSQPPQERNCVPLVAYSAKTGGVKRIDRFEDDLLLRCDHTMKTAWDDPSDFVNAELTAIYDKHPVTCWEGPISDGNDGSVNRACSGGLGMRGVIANPGKKHRGQLLKHNQRGGSDNEHTRLCSPSSSNACSEDDPIVG